MCGPVNNFRHLLRESFIDFCRHCEFTQQDPFSGKFAVRLIYMSTKNYSKLINFAFAYRDIMWDKPYFSNSFRNFCCEKNVGKRKIILNEFHEKNDSCVLRYKIWKAELKTKSNGNNKLTILNNFHNYNRNLQLALQIFDLEGHLKVISILTF